MEHPPPNYPAMLEHWMEWERGELPPGELMKRLKLGGMRELLEERVAAAAAGGATVADVLES